ncbi:hypothetical protein EI427_10375 [Flammeovirga pectinis]|uniref:Uncharacterized protein n=1 Tax=Flammeovirga pectinis TaxID=2494373 RepID=A0A3Q9FNB6_9BACT|nr:hypothetical protein [Flammeovirga pectinis]AZQ62628.1 hypothetical protein EI427_10375 [Flammeovirga pectinis]
MNNTEVTAIWEQIKHRKDVAKVHNLHFIKVVDSSLENPHLITWDFYNKEVCISEVPYVNKVDDEPINLKDYKYLWVISDNPNEQALFRILLNNDGRSLNLKTLFHPAHQNQNLKVKYLPFTANSVEA